MVRLLLCAFVGPGVCSEPPSPQQQLPSHLFYMDPDRDLVPLKGKGPPEHEVPCELVGEYAVAKRWASANCEVCFDGSRQGRPPSSSALVPLLGKCRDEHHSIRSDRGTYQTWFFGPMAVFHHGSYCLTPTPQSTVRQAQIGTNLCWELSSMGIHVHPSFSSVQPSKQLCSQAHTHTQKTTQKTSFSNSCGAKTLAPGLFACTHHRVACHDVAFHQHRLHPGLAKISFLSPLKGRSGYVEKKGHPQNGVLPKKGGMPRPRASTPRLPGQPPKSINALLWVRLVDFGAACSPKIDAWHLLDTGLSSQINSPAVSIDPHCPWYGVLAFLRTCF